MHRVFRLLSSVLLAPLLAHAAAAAIDGERLRDVARHHIVPAYAHLAATTRGLDEAAARCGDADASALRMRFADAFLAWQGINHLRFGPIQVLSRDFRFQLWPDKRGSVTRHVNALLASRDAAQLAPDTFAAGTAAVQGFGALEYLLYDNARSADVDPGWRCRVLRTITANLARMAADTLAEWRDGEQAHVKMFATAADGNSYYDSAGEVAGRLLNNLHTALEHVASNKLGRPLGETADKASPKRAEAWRSGLSLDAVKANLAAAHALYRHAFAPALTDPALADRIDAAFDAASEAADAITPPLAQAVVAAESRRAVQALQWQVEVLESLLADQLAPALGLGLGFNSLDGD
ncbi:MAG: imelysin family protein [Chromatiaceae bacterium]|nr:imelysin family protein [Chromatiaceae bacterium]MCP5421924.1 imelysin family protein [Chromatiaceae bacterium]